MATKAKSATVDVKEFTAPLKEFSKILKDTYLNTLDFSLSIAEENKKLFSEQVEYLYGAEKDYVKSVKDFYGSADLPFAKVNTKPFEEGIDRIVAIQKDYVDSVSGVTDSITADSYVIAKKNVEKAFSLFDKTLDSLHN